MNTSDFSSAGSAPGTPGEPPVPPQGTPDKVDEFFDSIRRAGIVRGQDRWIGGVASGVALRLGVDALLVRVAFGVLFLISGAGLVLYALGWALLPEQVDGRIHLQEAIRGRFDSALAGAGIVFVIGVTTGSGLGWWDGGHWFGALFWVALTVFGVYALVTYRNQRGETSVPPAPGAGPAAPSAHGPASSQPGGAYAPTATFPTGAAAPSVSTADVRGPNLQKTAPAAPAGPTPGGQAWAGSPAWTDSQAWAGPHTWGGSTPPAPPAPRTKSAGVVYVSSVLGLSLLVFAVLLLADRYGDFAYSPWLTAVGAAVVLTGLAIVVAGVRGRSSGGLGFLAIVAILVGGPAATWASDGLFLDGAARSVVGDSTYRPTTVDSAENGYSFGLGDLTLDLRELDLPTSSSDETVTIPVEMGAGNVTVIVPDDAAVSARVTLGAGRVYWSLDGSDSTRGGVGTSGATFETQDVREGATPDIHLVIKAGAGEIFIEEQS